MQYRLIEPEITVFLKYRDYIKNIYEFLELLFKAWKRANEENTRTKYAWTMNTHA